MRTRASDKEKPHNLQKCRYINNIIMNNHNQIDILKLFDEKPYLKICAPMVRYSKLQFRMLVKNYGCDLCYTPMILADSFCQSEKARINEFTTNTCDNPLIAQFAANNVHDFVGAAYMISPYCNGVGLNCGCPQRWARQDGLGCVMLENPQMISDIVKACRNQIPKPFTVSVKMRIFNDVQKTVEICRQLEKAGASFLSVHGRTPYQLTGDINVETIKLIVENVQCPIVANGGVKNLEDCDKLYEETNCKGVMVANGILSNPTLFSGSNETTVECINDFLNICYNSTLNLNNYEANRNLLNPLISEKPDNLTFQCFHHHLVFMLEKVLPKSKRRIFNSLQKFEQVQKFLYDEFQLTAKLYDLETFKMITTSNLDYTDTDCVYNRLKEINFIKDRQSLLISDSYCDTNDGAYFNKKVKEVVLDEYDLDNIFIEDG